MIKLFITTFFILMIASGCGQKSAVNNKLSSDLLAGPAANSGLVEGNTKELPLEVIAPPIQSNDHILGKADAPVNIIVYQDLQSEFTPYLQDALHQAQAEFGEQIAIIFRHYPREFNQLALTAAEYLECAGEQGAEQFWLMADLIIQNNREGIFTPAQFRQNAEILALDMEQFDGCAQAGRYQDKIMRAIGEGDQIGIRGVPSFFVNSQYYIGAKPYEDYATEDGSQKGLRSIIEEELEK